MQAKDLMTAEVIVVHSDTPAKEIAKLLLTHTISAVPVVDASGTPLGMVSEGDLIGRNDEAREARRDWWLSLLAEGHQLNPEFLASIAAGKETARDIMASPLITVSETTDAREIARLLAEYRIKRVPVVRDNAIVGIVSRADLLSALTAEPERKPAPKPTARLLAQEFRAAVESIDRHFLHLERETARHNGSSPVIAVAESKLNAADFRHLVSDFENDQGRRREAERQADAERRKVRVKELIDHHIEDENWLTLMHRARDAAARGEKRLLLLQFPSQLCSDEGRAINAAEDDWPETLRGEAAELYLRWEHDLKPQGFHLSAQVLDFPGGMPGDIGLFLVWGG
jgi:CBS domain-containing protein